MSKVTSWAKENIVCLSLVIIFIPLYIVTVANHDIFNKLGSTDLQYLDGQYYRWFTAIFIHHSLGHIFFNSLALVATGSLISHFIGKWKTLFIFVVCGTFAEIAYSIVVTYALPLYDGGSSGGIFALMGSFMVCYLRFPMEFNLKWFRLDVIIAFLYFILVNDNISSFLTHTFGFAFGIIITFIMVMSGIINEKHEVRIAE
ncbi:MAG: rhomboid family intramembrane serine protease [Lachnospiraceae bacterium]|nr:rhomboid family intramembrane serine protease [Lachnospiraceae bacterium]